MSVRIIELKKSVYENNDREADKLRVELRERGVFLINLMSSPGAGKTTTVLRLTEKLGGKYKIGVLEADIDSSVDAERVGAAGIRTVQLHTDGMCHLDAGMVRTGTESDEMSGVDLIILENIGNLVCPAEFDTGAMLNMMILSVPEGDDKPLKYPLMFSVCDLLLINKIDTVELFDFDFDAVKDRARNVNPEIETFEVSAKTGLGFDTLAEWIDKRIIAF